MPKGLLEKSIEMELINSELNEAQKQRAQETIDALSGVMTEYREAARHIRSDGRLTQAGQASDLAVLKTSTDGRLVQIGEGRLESLDKRLAELEFQTRDKPPTTDPLLRFMQEEAARRAIAERYSDELTLQAEYTTWGLQGGYDHMMRAVENAPLPLLGDPAVIENGKKARGLRQSPEAARTLRQLKTVRSTIAATLNAYRAEVGLPNPTIEAIAQGEAAA